MQKKKKRKSGVFVHVEVYEKGFKGQVTGDWVCLTIDFCLECMYVYMSVYVWRTAHTQLDWHLVKKKKCVCVCGGVQTKKKTTPLLHHLLLHFSAIPPFFSPSFTSLQFTPPSLSSSLLTSDTPLILPSTTTCPRGNMHCAALLLN